MQFSGRKSFLPAVRNIFRQHIFDGRNHFPKESVFQCVINFWYPSMWTKLGRQRKAWCKHHPGWTKENVYFLFRDIDLGSTRIHGDDTKVILSDRNVIPREGRCGCFPSFSWSEIWLSKTGNIRATWIWIQICCIILFIVWETFRIQNEKSTSWIKLWLYLTLDAPVRKWRIK